MSDAGGRRSTAPLNERRLQHEVGPRADSALRPCLAREERAFLIPVCRPLWKTQKDESTLLSGAAPAPADAAGGRSDALVDRPSGHGGEALSDNVARRQPQTALPVRQRQHAQAVHSAAPFGCVAQPLRTRAALQRARPARCSAVASSRSV